MLGAAIAEEAKAAVPVVPFAAATQMATLDVNQKHERSGNPVVLFRINTETNRLEIQIGARSISYYTDYIILI